MQYLWWIVAHLISVLGFLLAILVVGRAQQDRRSSAGTIAWVLTVLLIPYLGAILFLLFADRKLTRLAQRKPPLEPNAPPSFASNSIQRILASVGSPKASHDNEVTLLATGEAAFQEIVSLIDQAEDHISIATFLLGDDPVGQEIPDHLERRAREGISVNVLLDAWGSREVLRRAEEQLTAAGAQVAAFMPMLHMPFKGRVNLRNHRKMIITDSSCAIVGGMNLADEYIGKIPNTERWCDLSAKLRGSIVPDLHKLFWADWLFATQSHALPPEAPFENSAIAENKGACLQLVPSGPDQHSDALHDALLIATYEAQSRICITTPYLIPDDALCQALVLAVRRGVCVQIIVPHTSNHAIADLARGSYLRMLIAAGAQVLFFPRMIHAKCILFDSTLAILGSANFDMRSLFLNYELAVFLYDKPSIDTLCQWFEMQRLESTPGYVKRATYPRLFIESAMQLVAPLL